MDEEETIVRIITVIERAEEEKESYCRQLVEDLRSILDTDDAELLDRFYGSLSPVASSLLRRLSAAMDSQAEEGRLALLSSDAYLSILLSPNSPVFTFFSPVAFLSLLGSLRRYLKRRHQEKGSSSAVAHGSNVQREKGNRKRRGRGSRNTAKNWGHEAGDATEDRGFDVKLLFRVLEKLGSVLRLVHLDRFPDSLKSLVLTVSEIPVMALEFSGFFKSDGLIDLCGRILGEVLRADHGDMAVTAAEILKSLTPLLLMGKHQARSFALRFVSQRMMDLGRDSCEVKKAVINFPKYLAYKAPEKAESRGLAVEAIVEIIKAMEFEDQSGFVEYVMKMTQGKTNLRLLAVELIPLLINSLSPHEGTSSDSGLKDSWVLGCLDALLHRCSDSSALIRARALSNLAQVVGFLSSDESSRLILKEVLGFNDETSNGKTVINDLLRKRCVDEKAAVRKAALLLVTKLTSVLGGCIDVIILKTMGMACSDPLISIRKAAISALSEVLFSLTYSVFLHCLAFVGTIMLYVALSIQIQN